MGTFANPCDSFPLIRLLAFHDWYSYRLEGLLEDGTLGIQRGGVDLWFLYGVSIRVEVLRKRYVGLVTDERDCLVCGHGLVKSKLFDPAST